MLRAFTLTEPAEFRALKVPGWRTANGKKMQCETMDTTRPKRVPSWLRSGRGGALSGAFQLGKLTEWLKVSYLRNVEAFNPQICAPANWKFGEKQRWRTKTLLTAVFCM